MSSEKPAVVYLLNGLIKGIEILCDGFAIIPLLVLHYFGAANESLERKFQDYQASNRRVLHALLFLPRVFLAHIPLLLVVAYVAVWPVLFFYAPIGLRGIFEGLFPGLGILASIVATILVLGMCALGVYFMRESRFKVEIGIHFTVIAQSWIDMAGFFGFLLVFATVIRLIPLLWGLKNKTKSFRKLIFIEVIRVPMEYLMVPFFLVMAPLFWRWPALKRAWGDSYLENRLKLMENVAASFMDIPYLLLFLFISCFGYRTVPLWRDVFSTLDWDVKREVIGIHAGQLLFDVPCIILGVATLPFVWRSPFMVMEIAEVKTEVVRAPREDVGDVMAVLRARKESAMERRVLAIQHFFMVLLDLLHLVAAFTLLMTWYRWREATSAVRKEYDAGCDQNRWKGRGIWFVYMCRVDVSGAFLEVWREWVFDFPFLLCGTAASIFIYRVPAFWGYLRTKNTDDLTVTVSSRRWMAVKQLGLGLLDPVVLAGALIITVTKYRLKALMSYVAGEDGTGMGYKPIALGWHLQMGVAIGCWDILKDVPFVLLGVLALVVAPWRWRGLILGFKQAGDEGNRTKSRRWVIVEQFVGGIVDVPWIFLFFAAHLFAPWRIRLLWTELKIKDLTVNAEGRRAAVLEQAMRGIADLPFVVLGFFSLLWIWRVPVFYVDVTRASENVVLALQTLRAARRSAALYNFLQGWADLVAMCFGLAVVPLFLWRVPGLLSDLQLHHYWTVDGVSRRMAVYRAWREGSLDFIPVLLLLPAHVFVWRIPALHRDLRLFEKHSNEKQKQKEKEKEKPMEPETNADVDDVSETNAGTGIEPVSQRQRVPVSAYDRRVAVLHHCWNGALDFPFVVVGVFAHTWVWRIGALWKAVRGSTSDWQRRKWAAYHVSLGFVDVLVAVVVLFCHIFIWRVTSLWRGLALGDRTVDSTHRYSVAMWCLANGFIDLVYIFFGFCVLLMPWRIVPLWSELWEENSAKGRRKAAFYHFGNGLIDLPVIAVGLMSLVGFWRIPGLWRALEFGKGLKKEKNGKTDGDQDPEAAALDAKTQGAIVSESVKSVAMAPMRRRAAFHNFVRVILDFSIGAPFIFVLLSGWRARELLLGHRIVKRKSKAEVNAKVLSSGNGDVGVEDIQMRELSVAAGDDSGSLSLGPALTPPDARQDFSPVSATAPGSGSGSGSDGVQNRPDFGGGGASATETGRVAQGGEEEVGSTTARPSALPPIAPLPSVPQARMDFSAGAGGDAQIAIDAGVAAAGTGIGSTSTEPEPEPESGMASGAAATMEMGMGMDGPMYIPPPSTSTGSVSMDEPMYIPPPPVKPPPSSYSLAHPRPNLAQLKLGRGSGSDFESLPGAFQSVAELPVSQQRTVMQRGTTERSLESPDEDEGGQSDAEFGSTSGDFEGSYSFFFPYYWTWKQFFLLLLEIVPFVIPISALISITCWRAGPYWRAIHRCTDERRNVKKLRTSIVQLGWWFFDIVAAALFLVLLTPPAWIRIKDLIAELKRVRDQPDADADLPIKLRRSNHWQIVVVEQFGFFLIDVWFFPVYVFLAISFWRWLALKKLFKKREEQGENISFWQRRKLFAMQAGLIIVDLPTLCALVLLAITGYRLPSLWGRLKDAYAKDESIQRVILSQFSQLFFDLLHVPLAVLCLWRIPLVVYRMRAEETAAPGRRAVVIDQLKQTLLDIPTSLMAACVFVTIWRAPQLWRELRKFKRGDERYGRFHSRVLTVFVRWIRDVPFSPVAPIILIGALWRRKYIAKELARRPNDMQKRFFVVKTAGFILLDLVAAVATLLLACTWRLPTVIHTVRRCRCRAGPTLHLLRIFVEFVLFDLVVAAIAGPFILVAPWRWYYARRAAVFADGRWAERKAMLVVAMNCASDFFALVCLIPLVGTIWRLPLLKEKLAEIWKSKPVVKSGADVEAAAAAEVVSVTKAAAKSHGRTDGEAGVAQAVDFIPVPKERGESVAGVPMQVIVDSAVEDAEGVDEGHTEANTDAADADADADAASESLSVTSSTCPYAEVDVSESESSMRSADLWRLHAQDEVSRSVIRTFGSWLVDIPCVPFIILVVFSPFRWRQVWCETWRHGRQYDSGSESVDVVEADAENGNLATTSSGLPWTQQRGRLAIVEGAIEGIGDLLSIALLLPVAFLGWWRIGSLLRRWRAAKTPDDAFFARVSTVVDWTLDLPFVLVFGLTTVFGFWRWSYLWRHKKQCKSEWEKRILVSKNGCLVLADIVSWFMLLVVICTLWRIPSIVNVVKFIQKKAREEAAEDKEKIDVSVEQSPVTVPTQRRDFSAASDAATGVQPSSESRNASAAVSASVPQVSRVSPVPEDQPRFIEDDATAKAKVGTGAGTDARVPIPPVPQARMDFSAGAGGDAQIAIDAGVAAAGTNTATAGGSPDAAADTVTEADTAPAISWLDTLYADLHAHYASKESKPMPSLDKQDIVLMVIVKLFSEWTMDLLVAPAVVFCVVAFWRWTRSWRHLCAAKMGWEERFVVVLSALAGVADFLSWVGSVIVCVTLWRIPTLRRRLAVAPSLDHATAASWSVIREWILDLAVFPFGVVCAIAPWRWHYLKLEHDRHADEEWGKRGIAVKSVLLIFADIGALVAVFFIVVLGGWRIPLLWRTIKDVKSLNDGCRAIFSTLLIWIVDLPFAILALVVFISPWRWLQWRPLLKLSPTPREERVTVAELAAMCAADMLATIGLLCVIFTVWRVASLRRHLRLVSIRGDHWGFGVLECIKLWLGDTICLFLFVGSPALIVVGPWRWRQVVDTWNHERVFGSDDEWVKRKKTAILGLRVLVDYVAVAMLPLFIVVPWRIPLLLGNARRQLVSDGWKLWMPFVTVFEVLLFGLIEVVLLAMLIFSAVLAPWSWWNIISRWRVFVRLYELSRARAIEHSKGFIERLALLRVRQIAFEVSLLNWGVAEASRDYVTADKAVVEIPVIERKCTGWRDRTGLRMKELLEAMETAVEVEVDGDGGDGGGGDGGDGDDVSQEAVQPVAVPVQPITRHDFVNGPAVEETADAVTAIQPVEHQAQSQSLSPSADPDVTVTVNDTPQNDWREVYNTWKYETSSSLDDIRSRLDAQVLCQTSIAKELLSGGDENDKLIQRPLPGTAGVKAFDDAVDALEPGLDTVNPQHAGMLLVKLVLIYNHLVHSLMACYHYALLPFKAAAVLLVPIYVGIGWARPDMIDSKRGLATHPAVWTTRLHEWSRARLNFWEVDRTLVPTLISVACLMVHAFSMMAISLWVFSIAIVGTLGVGSLFKPEWKPAESRRADRVGLTLLLVYEAFSGLVAVALVVGASFWPLALIWVADPAPFISTTVALKAFLGIMWMCGVFAALPVMSRIASRGLGMFRFFRPWGIFIVLFYKYAEGVRTRRSWRLYHGALSGATSFFYNRRHSLGIFGELVLLTCTILWSAWFVAVPFVLAPFSGSGSGSASALLVVQWVLFAITVLGAMFLLYKAKGIVQDYWDAHPVEPDWTPVWEWDDPKTPLERAAHDVMEPADHSVTMAGLDSQEAQADGEGEGEGDGDGALWALPKGWRSAVDPRTKMTYYIDIYDQTTWMRPINEPLPLPSGWMAKRHPLSRKVYFEHSDGRIQNDMPVKSVELTASD